MKKILLVLLFVLLLTACGQNQEAFFDEAQVSFSEGNVIYDQDSHGGFHGDGDRIIVVDYSDEPLDDELAKNEHWRSLPLSQEATILVYGDGEHGPFINFDSVEFAMPEVEHGFYFFYNRQEVDNKYDESLVLNASSVNFTIGIYDSDTDILYVLGSDS